MQASNPVRAGALALLAVALGPVIVQAQEGMPVMGRPAQMKRVEFLVGTWNVDMKMRRSADEPWESVTVRATTAPVLDGCALRTEYTGKIQSMDFRGLDHLTFNRDTDRFDSVWVDNLEAKLSMTSGTFEQDGRLVMTGEDVQLGRRVLTRATTFPAEGPRGSETIRWTMESSADGGKTWVETMQLHFRRAS